MIYATNIFLSVFICVLTMLKLFFVVKFISFSFVACRVLVILKNIFSYPCYLKVHPCFLLALVQFHFASRSLIHLAIILIYHARYRAKLIFLMTNQLAPNESAPVILGYLLIITQISSSIWASFLTPHFIPLICLSSQVLIPHCLDYRGFVVCINTLQDHSSFTEDGFQKTGVIIEYLQAEGNDQVER